MKTHQSHAHIDHMSSKSNLIHKVCIVGVTLFSMSCTNNDAEPYYPPVAGTQAGATPSTAGTTGAMPVAGTTAPAAGTVIPNECFDRDRDGFQDSSCNPNVNAGGGDCNDSSNAINPGRVENCANMVDNNCNGLTPDRDPICQQACADKDNDGFQDAMCNSNPNNNGGDCNDENSNVYPGAREICGNQFDDDCVNGDIPCQADCTDRDQDGFGLGADCLGPDCNDNNAFINPFQSEICGDGIDQSCSGRDLACPQDCEDRDRDGFGIGTGCYGIDCNDDDPNINVAAVEIMNDRIDQDCDGSDLTTVTLCDDPDQDGYGVGSGCKGVDCDQGDPRIHSGRVEVCGNGLDDDCRGGDLVCTTRGVGMCVDLDDDGHGEGACRISGYDCNDDNNMVNPYAEEVCNGIDDNCNGEVDECSGRNQVCDTDGRCVGRVGAPCSSSDDCLVGQGLTCDPERGECRVVTGNSCTESAECFSNAECAVVAGCQGSLACYQRAGASCSNECDCTGDLACSGLNNVCVECDGDLWCNGEDVCTDGGFCVDELTIGEPSGDGLLELLQIIANCHRDYRGAPTARGCAEVNVGRELGSINGMILAALPDADGVDDFVCDDDGAVASYFGEEDYDRLREIFGCGLFDIWNIWWPEQIQADTTVCVYYAARKGGFGLPQRTRSEVIVVDQCTLSVIE